ncbi:MAG: non-heme iron oxygenase ferredoxin subunit [Anaerolineales bacterium]|nr:non-heme iron oxygenase ferredoxin subunit [Anaerolineales bacterium]
MFDHRKLQEGKLDYVTIGTSDELTEEEPLLIDIDGRPIAVISSDGGLYAIDDMCSHDGGSLADGDIEDGEIICPRHGARFSLETGQALTLPAVKDIHVYPVRIVDGEIQVGLPEEA